MKSWLLAHKTDPWPDANLEAVGNLIKRIKKSNATRHNSELKEAAEIKHDVSNDQIHHSAIEQQKSLAELTDALKSERANFADAIHLRWDVNKPFGWPLLLWRQYQVMKYLGKNEAANGESVLKWIARHEPNPWPELDLQIINEMLRYMRILTGKDKLNRSSEDQQNSKLGEEAQAIKFSNNIDPYKCVDLV